MGEFYEKKIKQYNEKKRVIKESINKTTKRTLIILDMLLLVLVIQLGIILATNENIIKPNENQYLEFRTVEVKEVAGGNKQVIMELWANNLELKGFDIHFSYDPTKLKPSILQTNEVTEEETEYFQFEQEFKDVLELFIVPTEREGEIRGVVTFEPPVEETEHIVEKVGVGKVLDSQGSVLLGKMSFQMTSEVFDISWFNVIKDETISLETGVKISQDGKKYYEEPTTLRFTDYKVFPNEVKEIEIGKMPKTEYKYGEVLNVEGGTLIITRNNGEKEEIEIKENMIQEYEPNKLGEQTITIEYEGKTVTYIINIEDYIKDIEIQKPAKLIYNIGEQIELTGGTVTPIMASGEKKEIIEITDSRVQVGGFDTTVEGAKLIEVTYEGITKGFGITVVQELENINLKELPIKTEYLYGEELDVTGGVIEFENEDGEKETIEITKDMVTGYEPEKIGDQTLTIEYKDLKVEYIVHVEDYIKSIKVEAPTKTEYEYGEDIELAGGTVSVVMASGEIRETVDLMKYMTKGFEKEKVGKQTIRVEYKGLEGSFEINVEDKIKNIAINTEPDKTQYKYGEKFEITGGTIRVIRTSGTEIIPITMDMISGYNPTSLGTQVITVTYQGYTTKFIVSVDKEVEKPDNNDKPDNNNNNSNNSNNSNNNNNLTNNNEQNTTVEKPTDENQVEMPEEPKQDEITEKPEEKPTETLGEQEQKENSLKTKKILSIALGALGAVIILILVINKHNVKVYVAKNNKYKLIGKDKISKKNPIFDMDKYLNEDTYQNEVKIELSKLISKKLNGKEIEITYKREKIRKEINYENKSYKIYLNR